MSSHHDCKDFTHSVRIEKPNLSDGLEMGLSFVALQMGLAVISYGLGCFFLNPVNCSISAGVDWILAHPIFRGSIPGFSIFGFFFGTFYGTFLSLIPKAIREKMFKHGSILAWLIVIFLVTAFALWGVPNMFFLMRNPLPVFQ